MLIFFESWVIKWAETLFDAAVFVLFKVIELPNLVWYLSLLLESDLHSKPSSASTISKLWILSSNNCLNLSNFGNASVDDFFNVLTHFTRIFWGSLFSMNWINILSQWATGNFSDMNTLILYVVVFKSWLKCSPDSWETAGSLAWPLKCKDNLKYVLSYRLRSACQAAVKFSALAS